MTRFVSKSMIMDVHIHPVVGVAGSTLANPSCYAKIGIMNQGKPRPLEWVGSSLRDMRRMPASVREVFGYALYLAQCGDKHPQAKPLKGFGGAGVLEVVEDHRGDTYRAVYTVRLQGRVYVLHVFQKKSKTGIATDAHDIELIHQRLQSAGVHHGALP